MGMLCVHTSFLIVIVLTFIPSCDTFKPTQRPKYQYTKKPPREVVQTTVYAAKTTVTARIVDHTKPRERFPASITESTTVPADSYIDYPTDTTISPTTAKDNYTLDYNECYFNFCECCPPEKGPQGFKGDIGLPGQLSQVVPTHMYQVIPLYMKLNSMLFAKDVVGGSFYL